MEVSVDPKTKYKDWYDKYDKIEAHLFRDPIFKPFGIALMGFEVEFDNFSGVPDAVNLLKENRILINVNSILLKERTGLNFIVLHEIWHHINMYMERANHRDPELWNISDDYCGNLFIHELEKLSKVKSNGQKFDLDVMEIKHKCGALLRDEFQNMITEEIYDKLKSKGQYSKKEYTKKLKEIIPSTNGTPDGEIDALIKEIHFKYKEDRIDKKEIILPQPTNGKDGEKTPAQKLIEKAIKTFRHMMLDIGKQLSDINHLIERLFATQIPWNEILRDLTTLYIKIENETTWSRERLSSFINPELPILPGYDDEEIRSIVFFVIDQSGSVSDEDMGKVLNIILQSREFFEFIWVIKHDMTCTNLEIYEAKNIGENEKKEICTRKKCGGTSHKDAFKIIKEKYEKQDINQPISCVIFCTDLCSDINEHIDILPKELPYIWIVPKQHQPNVKLKGKKIIINDN
jgi:hypothetical protein